MVRWTVASAVLPTARSTGCVVALTTSTEAIFVLSGKFRAADSPAGALADLEHAANAKSEHRRMKVILDRVICNPLVKPGCLWRAGGLLLSGHFFLPFRFLDAKFFQAILQRTESQTEQLCCFCNVVVGLLHRLYY